MAIVIEEEGRKSGVGLLNVVLWLALLAGIAAGAYYVFFKAPQLIEVASPNEFKNAEQISKLQLRPEEIVSNPQFKALRKHVTLPIPTLTDRPNPFISF